MAPERMTAGSAGRLLGMVGRLRVTLAYAAVLVAGWALQALLPARVVSWLLDASSTSVANLLRFPGPVLVASLAWVQDHALFWIVCVLVGVGGLEARFGRSDLAALAGMLFGAHVVATYASEGVVVVRELLGRLPHASLHSLDVGPSYLAAAACAGLLVTGPWLLRALAAVLLAQLIPYEVSGLPQLDLAAMGHLAAIIAGIAAGFLLARRLHRPAG